MQRVPPRVLFIAANYAPEPSGSAPYTTSLAEMLVSDETTVSVITTHPHYPEWRITPGYGAWSASERRHGVTVRRLRHFVPANPTLRRRLFAELSFGIRAASVRWPEHDVMVLASPSLFSTLVVTLRRCLDPRRRPAVVWVQDLYSLGVTETGAVSGAPARFVASVEGWTLRRADRVVTIHDRFSSHVTRSLGVDPRRTTTIRNWTHLEPSPSTDAAATRAKLAWGDDEVIVLHAGNQGVKQGLENVVEAARLADECQSRVRFVLLGDGNQHEYLRHAATGVRAITFIPPVPDANFSDTLAAADILLVNELPSLAQMSVPSKLTSYFASGRPVLAATPEGSTTAGELSASDAGVRVEPDDPAALLRAAEELGAAPERCRALGAAGIVYRKKTLSADAALTRFLNVLAPLATKQKRHNRHPPEQSTPS